MGKTDFERVLTINAQKERIADLEADKRDLLRALREARADLLELADSEQHLAPAIERIDEAIAKAETSDAAAKPKKARGGRAK